ncbi:Thiol:disulfide interchange protein DsbD precursor [Pseudomonas sp. THAF187a]|uniref:protein-disulfide reductase DsbD n=1 Tax=unclassified Pseudomonas TaxID=196821 RepID=UPI00126895C3|nr:MULTISPECIES: protein-disulfide reductase DsbD [unclassified Pseudomonas]QFT20652.1 Thiol:disulfide interchange protein DsbD precursor [Pseudomonas sp. THAF187a]QFT40842.1 Thiol:disulfide interchange protein DsbD precursor [Pseudomonas sp. THAF42]
MSLRRLLLPLLLLCLSLPASANLFDQRPAASPLGAPLNNSSDFLPVREAFKLSLVSSDTQSVTLRFVAAEGYYLYRHRLNFSVEPAGFDLGEAQLPAGKAKHDEFFGDVEVYYGVLDVRLPLDNPDNRPLRLQVGYQGCADKGLCYPPETEYIEIGEMPASVADLQQSEWTWKDLALFFLAGLGLTFTPCVLPMLPILSGVVLRGRPSNARGLVLSLAYVLPMAACYAVLGSLMGLFGAGLNLQAMLQSPWVLVPFAAFFGLFAMAMFGVFELRLPAFIRDRLDQRASQTRGGTIAGAATLGVLSSLIVSPCITAPLTALLLYISSTGDAVGGGLQLFALGLGMGTPLVLFGAGGGALLPKSGPWLVTVRNAFGVMLLAVSVWLLERVLPGSLSLALWGLLAGGVAVFLGALEFGPKTHRQKLTQIVGLALLVYALAAWVGALQGTSDPLKPLGQLSATASQGSTKSGAWQTLSSPAELDAALAEAKAAGQPLLLDWYADWCISCKVIEREVFGNAEVGSKLAGWRLIRFDITESSAAQRALLDRYQLFGPPAIQLFSARGDELLDLRVVGEVDAATFGVRLDRAVARSSR